jgi:HupE/UreJ protein
MPRRLAGVAAVLGVAACLVLMTAPPASAHGITSVVYVDLTSPGKGHVRAVLGLEYDLLALSTADWADDQPLSQQGMRAFEDSGPKKQAAVLDAHADSIMKYVTERFGVSAGRACTPTRDGGFGIERRKGTVYSTLALDYRCPTAEAHEVRSALFPDTEGYVISTKTIVTYDLDLTSGSAALDAQHQSFSTRQSGIERFWEFFRLGAEHLLTGLDHILFLLALIAGSRRLREVVLAATTFTLAHSVTFILAALGLVKVPASIIEPLIALSIAIVAAWPLWRLWRRGPNAIELDTVGEGHFSLDRTGWTRLGVVFCFGLAHGLGFASALGIDTAFSWKLLWSLLVFNFGIEMVQLSIIAAVFPLLAMLRRRSPIAPRWITGTIAAGVSVAGLTWFVQRAFGI